MLLWDIISLIKDHYHWYHLSSHQMLKPPRHASYNTVLVEHQAECGAGICVSSRKKDALYQYTASHTDIAV